MASDLNQHGQIFLLEGMTPLIMLVPRYLGPTRQAFFHMPPSRLVRQIFRMRNQLLSSNIDINGIRTWRMAILTRRTIIDGRIIPIWRIGSSVLTTMMNINGSDVHLRTTSSEGLELLTASDLLNAGFQDIDSARPILEVHCVLLRTWIDSRGNEGPN